MQFTDGPRK